MSDPLVSVLMPVRNGMPYVVGAAQSVFAQTYRNIELIVQDCVSNDGTAESLRELLVPSGMRLERVSWLAKSRMRGDGPPYIRVGRSIRYAEAALIQWMKSETSVGGGGKACRTRGRSPP
jgi:glycosyltransferase involved in cell wall biosynthesis